MLGVMGDIISVKKIENPTSADISALLTVLENRMTDTFNKHKSSFGWGDVELNIK
jgi:hypothetical protein